MKTIPIQQISKEFLTKEISLGKIFIYPTDTVYGLGCDARNKEAIEKIYSIKKRSKRQVLIIVPSKEWIKENTQYHKDNVHYLNKLPGPYSFIVNLKNKDLIAENARNEESIGIRIPNNNFTKLLQKTQIPFVTTSVNFSGEPSAITIEQIPKEILDQVDYLITTEEELSGKSSTLYDIREETIICLRK